MSRMWSGGIGALLALALAGVAGATPPGSGALPGAPPHSAELRERLAAALAAEGPGYVPRSRHRHPDGSPVYTNRLLLETSPYLRQHAHNPVDWRPWGDEAFAEAARLSRPVLVSIGYSTCHWCHVMEEESFDDPEIAELLNAHFIAIKVDREIRPDIDSVYMAALHAMRGRGGWPLNVFVTPDRQPFFGGTYFPPEDRGGRPGLATILRTLAEDWEKRPERSAAFAERLQLAVRARLEAAVATRSGIPSPQVLERAADEALSHFDWQNGGLEQPVKFPGTTPLRFLLRHHRRSGSSRSRDAVWLSLDRMAAGGLRDQLGGGFHRYSTDAEWHVPHFEMMLYDNARLALVYTEAWQASGRDAYAEVARGILDYLLREMAAPGGGFYSATDADSRRPDGEMREGWYYTWTPAEIEAAVGSDRAPVVQAWFGVSEEGSLEGRSVLRRIRSEAEVAAALDIEPEALRSAVEKSLPLLRAARAERPAPLRDEKVLAAWNGLALSAFARAGLAFGEARYLRAAERCAEFLLGPLRPDARLRRVYHRGRAEGTAFLEDYAAVIGGLIDLYEASPEPRWLREALALQALLDRHYADAQGGGYFASAEDGEQLLAREKPIEDGALPSGQALSALNLLRLADLSSDLAYRKRADLIFSAVQPLLERHAGSFSELLVALDYRHDTAKEIVLVSPAEPADVEPLLGRLRRSFVPNRVLSRVTEGPDLEAHQALVPLVAYKRARGGRPTAYVCENRVCQRPTEDPEVFAEQIARVEPLLPEAAGAGP